MCGNITLLCPYYEHFQVRLSIGLKFIDSEHQKYSLLSDVTLGINEFAKVFHCGIMQLHSLISVLLIIFWFLFDVKQNNYTSVPFVDLYKCGFIVIYNG